MHSMGPYVHADSLYQHEGTSVHWLARAAVLACVPVHVAEISEQEIASLNTNVDRPAGGDGSMYSCNRWMDAAVAE
jgi:hypothetical protein